MKLEFFHDDTGEPRARGRGRSSRLAAFLQSDVQESRTVLRKIARAIESVESGEEERWESTGNAYTLTLTPQGATIESLVELAEDEAEPTRLSLADLRAALGEWAELLSSDPNS